MSFLQQLFQAVRETITTPQANPRQTLIIGTVLILLIAIIVLIGLSIYPWLTGSRKKVVARKKPRPLTPRQKWTLAGIIGALLLVVLVGGFLYVNQSSFCANCHLEARNYQTWQQSSHRDVGCLSCHVAPSASGFVMQKIDYMRWLWSYSFRTYHTPLQDSVDNASCRRCHISEISKVITRQGIKVRHKDFLDKGSRCTDCHNAVGHEVSLSRRPSMNECLTCHDTKTASAKCETCHTPSTPGSQRIKREVAPVTVAPFTQCRGCHKPSTLQRCMQCHGLEMPHPPGFREGHSRLAFSNKDMCLRCHTFPSADKPPGTHGGGHEGSFCNNCHAFPSPHGTSERWARDHGPIALGQVAVTEAVCSAASCHGSGPSPIIYCAECHGTDICDRCHEAGKYTTPRPPL